MNITSYVVSQIPGAAVGTFVIGPFIPSILRKIKAVFVKESKVVEADVKAEEQKIAKKL